MVKERREYFYYCNSTEFFNKQREKRSLFIIQGWEKSQTTNLLSEQFARVSIKEYSWSPDGTKIAFWVNTNFPLSEDEEVPYELAIVDAASGNVANLCITDPSVTAKQLAAHAGFEVEPVWSQDGNALLIQIVSVEKSMPDFHTETILVNPSKLIALAMMKDAELKGWMINEP